MALKFTKTAILCLIAASLLPATAAQAAGNDLAYYTITNVETREIPSIPEQPIQAPTASAQAPRFSTNLVGIDISDIVNIGKQIWNIIEANQPVANVTMNSASAVPEGITNWQDLAGWEAPQTKTYETTCTNGFGMTVVDFQYRISFIPGGTYNGRGKYLANVTVEPQNVTVAWGFKFNAQATVPSITNAGTVRSPIAAANVVVQWSVDTVAQHQSQSAEYYLRGDGMFEEL